MTDGFRYGLVFKLGHYHQNKTKTKQKQHDETNIIHTFSAGGREKLIVTSSNAQEIEFNVLLDGYTFSYDPDTEDIFNKNNLDFTWGFVVVSDYLANVTAVMFCVCIFEFICVWYCIVLCCFVMRVWFCNNSVA